MSETTRRQFLEMAGTAAAATVLAPTALAAGQSAPVLVRPGQSPLPIGPGAPYVGYQSEIYLAGMTANVKPIFTTNLSDLEAAAGKVLPEAARTHLLAWARRRCGRARERAGDEEVADRPADVRRPRRARLDRDGAWRLHAGPDHPRPGRQPGPRAPRRRGRDRPRCCGPGLTYVHASQSSTPVEGVALAAPIGSRWFALDWPEGNGPNRALLSRARLTGCTHLVLSPPQPRQDWTALAAVRNAWDGPIVLGGIQTVRDARMAVSRGLDGIVVSNERGRRGPSPTGTIDILPRIADAVGSKVAVLFGSGVRTGTDAYRALALGAEAVVIGRPYVHGLALGGEAGVRHMLRTLLAELDITLGIAGADAEPEQARPERARPGVNGPSDAPTQDRSSGLARST